MSDTCEKCGKDVGRETARSTPAGGFVCLPACPPVVAFQREVICEAHKRCTPGSNNCADPPCINRHYSIDGERSVNGVPIASVTTITREVGDQFGVGAWWGQSIGSDAVLTLVKRGLLRWEG